MTPKGNIHEEIKKLASLPSLVKGTSVLKVTDEVCKVSDTPSKRKDISPLQVEGRRKRNINSREEKPEQNAPCDLELETDSPEADQEVKDPVWQQVETRKMEKKEIKKEENEYSRSMLRTRRTHPCALIIKPSEGKSYADIINKIKKDPTLHKVGLGVARVRKTLAGMSFSYSIRITRTKPQANNLKDNSLG